MNHTNPNHRWRRWAPWALAALVAAALAFWAFQPRPLLVEVAPVTTGVFEQVIEEDGQLRLKHRYLISAPTQAELARPTLKVGDAVRAGDVVATLAPVAPQMIDARTRLVLQQRVGSADAARRAASAQLQRLDTALAQASLEVERAQKLARENFIAPSVRDAAVLAKRSAQQALDAGRAEQRASEFALAEAQAALARSEPGAGARVEGLWTLKSPVDGQVIKLHLDSAAPVTAGQHLLEIGDTTAMEAVVDVLSSEVQLIAPGAPASLTLTAGAPALSGHVVRIEPVAFTKVSALGIEEQRVNVIVDLDTTAPRTQRLGDGFRVDARITVSTQAGALLVPSAALVREGTAWRVFVVEGQRAVARTITLRERNADVAWVGEGVREGERVLLYPGSTITDGQAVKVR
ncbi:efflux RND transporter periplasmic adaptor subunit [Hydrogenophaga sp. PBL-H3]|uniref:efflux RND transporter periplasmic adaptor subunit n=1 Tax=Hydrogenophaga sp. PBL-H3 TaxID=434010 RepID=UPI0013200007|nr:HlyD family efflux transporter periplasmic adaptor subunit [Hydrogenophaga sp. PBL-H3]QHE76875.1 HlyD family efflux transporter periplasmic adaptor subunit [Hydrogenophaga sp. PBL-H3]QHE81299.1 HlyD family efflux transporter periplasmic adaptor subunit [Hydrogenophaga sp. PBL-H3]